MTNIENNLKTKLAERDAQRLTKQIAEWTAEMRGLADLVAAATGRSCALVLVTGDDDYAHLAADQILDDGLRVEPGFKIELLNPTN